MSFLEVALKKISESGHDKSKRRILFLYILAALILFILYFFLFLKPTIAKLFDVIPKARGLKTEIKSVIEDLNYEDKFKLKHKEIVERIGGYEKKLSREKEIPELLESLSNMAKSSHVKILSITPLSKELLKEPQGLVEKDRIYENVPIAITAQGGYHDLGDFISKLEGDQRFLQVVDLDIRGNKANPKRHDIDIVVFAYTFKGSE